VAFPDALTFLCVRDCLVFDLGGEDSDSDADLDSVADSRRDTDEELESSVVKGVAASV